MKRFVLALFSLVAPFAGQAGVTVHLSFDSPKTLPSVPMGISITAENSGVDSVRLPAIIWMRIDRGNGQPILLPASQSSGGMDGVAIPEDLRSIPAQSTRIICRVEPTLFLTGTPWFGSKLISGPGTFVLQAILSDDLPDITAPRIASNASPLTAVLANEQDRAAWAWLVSRGSGAWTGLSWATNAWADEMLARFPQSNYAPYALAFMSGSDLDERDRITRRVLGAFPRFALADDLKLELARQHRQKFLLLQHDDFEHAVRHADAARELASDVAAHAVGGQRRKMAEDILAHTPARGEAKRPY